MGDMTEPAIETPSAIERRNHWFRLAAELGQQDDFVEMLAHERRLPSTRSELAKLAPVVSRELILSTMIAHIFEEGDTGLVRQGMPQAEWTLLSLAADAVAALLDGMRSE